MKKPIQIAAFVLCIVVFTQPYNVVAFNNKIKVLDIETNTIIKEQNYSEDVDEEVKNVIRSITNVTVQANPIPKQGYLLRIPLVVPQKVKNKWFDDIVSEALVLYNPAGNGKAIVILYNDDNTPVFFDSNYDLSKLLRILELKN